MTRGPIIMYAVAAIAGAGGVGVLLAPGKSEGATYAKRIGATMLLALALILAVFATALTSWGAGA